MKATISTSKPIPRNFTPPLSDEDMQFIREHHTKYSLGEIAQRISKSRSRIYCFYVQENLGGIMERIAAKKQIEDDNTFKISERENWLI